MGQLGLADMPLRVVCSQAQLPIVPSDPTNDIPQGFVQVFQDGLGRCTCTQAVLRLYPGCQPVFRPKRPVAYAALPLVDAELRRLEELGALIPVSPAWPAPDAAIKKPSGPTSALVLTPLQFQRCVDADILATAGSCLSVTSSE
nr:unnamed protein product [Spirometra erinaceieuropaei]